MMRKSLGFFAAGLASLAMLGGAEAKMVRYEINGQRYSYNTNNREQVEEAAAAHCGGERRRRGAAQGRGGAPGEPAGARYRLAHAARGR